MTIAIWASRLVLASVFAVAAVEKLRDLDGTRRGVVDLGVSNGLAGVVTALLPLSELTAAVALLVPLRRIVVGGVALALVLLIGFSTAIVRTLAAGRHPPCHCFGARSSAPLSTDALVRNAALGALALVVLFG